MNMASFRLLECKQVIVLFLFSTFFCNLLQSSPYPFLLFDVLALTQMSFMHDENRQLPNFEVQGQVKTSVDGNINNNKLYTCLGWYIYNYRDTKLAKTQ